MIAMAARTADKHQDPTRTPMLVYGLIFGPGLGMIVALVLAGGEAIAFGLVAGACLGVVVGVVLDSEHERRTMHRG